MIATAQIFPKAAPVPTVVSEIFPLSATEPNCICFQLTPLVERQLGNRFSWRFSQKFTNVIVVWQKQYFWVVAKPGQVMPTFKEWQRVLAEIQEDLRADIDDQYYTIQKVNAQVTDEVLADLAVRILQRYCRFFSPIVWTKNQVEVKREIQFWAETIDVTPFCHPALALTVHSSFLYSGDLQQFYTERQQLDADHLLQGLKVRDIEHHRTAHITGIAGTIKERRNELIKLATEARSKQALLTAPDEQPVVAVQFGKNTKRFHYAMAALHPCITADTASRFSVVYGELLKQTKIPYQERRDLIIESKEQAKQTLAEYGIELHSSINSRLYSPLFLLPTLQLEKTKLLFGNGYIGTRDQVLSGLSAGGVYRRHLNYKDLSRQIRISVLILGDFTVNKFLDAVQQRLSRYKFKSLIVRTDSVLVQSYNNAEDRNKVEVAINSLMVVPTDIVFMFLPESDRDSDDREGDSFYALCYSRLQQRGVACQAIYKDTLKTAFKEAQKSNDAVKQILNQVIPALLAKLGNTPYILAEPLSGIDYFIGFDVSRTPKKKLSGSKNACASVRIYGSRGEWIRCRTADALIDGEEISRKTLESFLPASELQGKTVLIYRDGRFCGQEVNHLVEWEKVIGARFILVECRKSGIPRLYLSYVEMNNNSKQLLLKAPKPGIALRLSASEVILVTTDVKYESMGLPLPLRLRIVCDSGTEGNQLSLENLVEATLKLTLLHYGSLNEPRLPVPLYASDRIAYRRLQGIYLDSTEDERQSWL